MSNDVCWDTQPKAGWDEYQLARERFFTAANRGRDIRPVRIPDTRAPGPADETPSAAAPPRAGAGLRPLV